MTWKITDVQKLLTLAVRKGRNVLLIGPHGIGKSSLVSSAARELGLSLAYFNAATLDPFADLVGVPVPVGSDDGKRIEFLRPIRVNDAQILCFDDLNRAPAKVLNAVFGLIQFRSINGELLARLVSVIGVINPADGNYQVQELDSALIDRFKVFLHLDPAPCREWFIEKFGRKLGGILMAWYATDLDDEQRSQVTPRRLEYLGENISGPYLRYDRRIHPSTHRASSRSLGVDPVCLGFDGRDSQRQPS